MSGNSSYDIKCLCVESVIISISWRLVQQFLAGVPPLSIIEAVLISKSGNVPFAILRAKINNLLQYKSKLFTRHSFFEIHVPPKKKGSHHFF